jgi:aarF domain-containing kinase
MKIYSTAIGVLLAAGTTAAFHSPTTYRRSSALQSTKERTSSVTELSKQMRDMQSQISENEEAALIIQALRGKNMNDDDSALEGLEMKLIEFDDVSGADKSDDRLPYEYDPVALKNFFSKRPNLIAKRIAQVASTGGAVMANFILDSLSGKLKSDPDLEVRRAGELRDTITSLGPFFIKLGQVSECLQTDIMSYVCKDHFLSHCHFHF